MAAYPCVFCGKPISSAEAANELDLVCAACKSAQAIATAEDAVKAKVTPAAKADDAFAEGLPPFHEEPRPAIRKALPGVLARWTPTLILLGAVLFTLLLCIALVLPAYVRVRDAAARTQTISNMKQIGLAIHAYHDVNRRLPTPKMTTHKEGKFQTTDLSWRVSILPYVDANAVFTRFDITKDWDDRKNDFAREIKMPVYVSHSPYLSGVAAEGETHFQYFTGPLALFPDAVNALPMADIKRGTSNTFLFAEAAQPIYWARPGDMAIRADQPLPLPVDAFLVCFVDGTVRVVNQKSVDDASLRTFIDPNDPRMIGLPF